MRDAVLSLTEAQSKDFCLVLWHELTIAGRGVWADVSLSEVTQLNSLRWLNEIQHRVWNAHASTSPESMPLLLNRIIHHCESAPELKPLVRVALDRSLAKVVRQTPGQPQCGPN